MSVSRWMLVASVAALLTACCCRSRCRPCCEPCLRPTPAAPARAEAPPFRGCALPIPAEVLAEIEEERSQVAALRSLHEKRVLAVTFADANLDAVVAYLRTVTGLNFSITPNLRTSSKFDDVKVNISYLDNVSAYEVVQIVTQQVDLRWEVQRGVVTIGTKGEIPDPPSAPPTPDPPPAAHRHSPEPSLRSRLEPHSRTG